MLVYQSVMIHKKCKLAKPIHLYQGNPTYPPPKATPPRNNGLIRPHQGKPMVNKPVIRPYFWGGYMARRGWLTIAITSIVLDAKNGMQLFTKKLGGRSFQPIEG